MSLSVPELLRELLLQVGELQDAHDASHTNHVDGDHVMVGPADHDLQQAGVASITEHSQARREDYLPLAHQRVAVRCLAPTQEWSERLSRAIRNWQQDFRRRVATQPSTGEDYLVHSVLWSGGPIGARDSDVTWENLLFLELMVGMEVVSA